MPRPCLAAKCLEFVFPIWFTHCDRVWFTLALPCSDHAVLLKATAHHGRLSTTVLCYGLEKNGMVRAWNVHGMASVNRTRPHCVNQMGKTHSKPLAARHGRGTAWARDRHSMLCMNRPLPSDTCRRLNDSFLCNYFHGFEVSHRTLRIHFSLLQTCYMSCWSSI